MAIRNPGRNPLLAGCPLPPPAGAAVNIYVPPLLHITPSPLPTFVCTQSLSRRRGLSGCFRRLFPRIYEYSILPLVDILVVSLQVFLEANQGQAARGRDATPHVLSFAGRWNRQSADKTALNVRKFHRRYPFQTKEECPDNRSPGTPKGPQPTHYPTPRLRRALRAANVETILQSCIYRHHNRRGFDWTKDPFGSALIIPEVSCGCRPFRCHGRCSILTQRGPGFGTALHPPRCPRDEGRPGFASNTL